MRETKVQCVEKGTFHKIYELSQFLGYAVHDFSGKSNTSLRLRKGRDASGNLSTHANIRKTTKGTWILEYRINLD